jgi:TonB-linked SusC/RagA family outer membrane protein
MQLISNYKTPPGVRSLQIKILLIMKLATCLMLFVSLQVSANGVAQKVTLNENKASLEKVLKKIGHQTGYTFLYENKVMEKASPVTLKINEASLDQALTLCFKDQPLTYKIFESTVVIKEKIVRYALINEKILIPAANIITGKVVNSAGEPLAGVSVTVKGANTGTSTDTEGNYSIDVSEKSILVFSYVGYVDREVVIGNQKLVNVELALLNTSLNTIVVTGLGIKREGKAITYSTQTVKGNDLNIAKELNPINSLKGRVAGVTITNFGDGISSKPKVLLRGSRSITGNNEPLYITDGVPSNMGLLDPNNIESVTVLKGASAAAIYGSAGQNGVIIITTKKGKSGKFVVNYNGGLTFDQALVLSEFQYEYGQGEQGTFFASSENSWGPKATGQMVTLWNGKSVPLKGQPNRFKEFYQTGKSINNSISVSGGSDKMQTYFSYANTRVLGVLRTNNDLTRHTVDLKVHNNITSKFSIDANITYSNEDMNVSSQYPYSSVYVIPTSIPFSEMKEYRYVDNNGVIKQNYWKPNSLGSNPYFTMNGDLSNTSQNKVMGLFSAKYQFASWIDLQVRANITKTASKNELKKYAGISTVQSVWGSDYYLNSTESQSTYMDALLTFRRDLNEQFKLSGSAGGSIQDARSEAVNSHANGLHKEDFFYIGNAKAALTTNSYRRSPQVQGLYALATLAYRNYLFMDLTARNDWSSALPKNHESYFYPSAGLTAVFSDMVEMPSWVSFGKARVSFAQSGYGGVEYLGQNYYSVGVGGVIITPTIQSLGDYKPELTSSFESGLDWRFFDNRLGFNLTYYSTETKNQLLLIGAPSASLFDQRYINAGLIKNSGIELTLNATPVKTKDFAWDITINYAKNNNKVLKLTDEIKSVIISGGGGSSSSATVKVVEGDSYGDIYVKGWQRDSLGRKLVNDVGIPLLTGGQDVNIGNYNPNYLMGMSNNFSYKNFSLNFLIDYRNGGQVISASQALLDGRGHTKATLNGRENGIVLDAYTLSGKKNDKAISAQSYYSSVGDIYLAGEFYNYSATNMRLRELILTYKLPNSVAGKGILKDSEFSLVGRNLFYFQRSAPFDPEIGAVAGNSGGQEFGYIPSTRSLGFNIKLSL